MFVGSQFINCIVTRMAATNDTASHSRLGYAPIAIEIATKVKRRLISRSSSEDARSDHPLPGIAKESVYANNASTMDSQQTTSARCLREQLNSFDSFDGTLG